LYRAPTKTFKIQFQKLKQKRLIITVKNPQTDLFGLLKSENTNLLWFKIIRFVFDIVLKIEMCFSIFRLSCLFRWCEGDTRKARKSEENLTIMKI
jgi:hypothetical protein